LKLLQIPETVKVEVTNEIREWNYGSYEGKTRKEVNKVREEQSLHKWNIFRDGCPDGE